jgi:hypothetical protein
MSAGKREMGNVDAVIEQSNDPTKKPKNSFPGVRRFAFLLKI